MVPLSIARRIPGIIYLSTGGTLRLRERSKHVLAFSEVTSQIRGSWKQSDLAVTVAEFALKPFSPMFVVFVSLQIGGTGTLMTADIAAERLRLEMYVREVFVSDIGSGKAFKAGRTFVRSIAAMAPGVPLNAVGISMWMRAHGIHRTADPSTKDIVLGIVGLPKMLMHIITKFEGLAAGDPSSVSPLARNNAAVSLVTDCSLGYTLET